MRTEFRVELGDFDARMQAFAAGVKDPSQPLKQWAVALVTRIWRAWEKMTFRSLYKTTGLFRGETWRQVNPMRVRKDGTEIPPWGGVRKANGSGSVKGRKRPSGQRVTPNSRLGVDHGSGGMRQEFISGAALGFDRKSITLTTHREYAPKQNALRPFAFVTHEDELDLVARCNEWVAKKCAEANR